MHTRLSRLLLFAISACFAGAAAAQYYPPPPPPPPPPTYPGPTYPPPAYPPPGSQRGGHYPSSRPDYRQSEVSPYVMFSAGHYSGLGVGNGTPSTQSGGLTALGGTFGVSFMGATAGPVRVGGDGRLFVANSANSTQYGNKLLAGLVGLRIDGGGGNLPIVPYFQFEVGGAGTNNGTSTTRTGAFAYQAQFGADFRLASPVVSARVEYGAGQLVGVNNQNHTLQNFSAGLVFHLR